MPGPGDPDDDQDGGYVLGLEGNMLYQHECHGHWPYDKGCDACVQARGRTRARSRKHEENQELLDEQQIILSLQGITGGCLLCSCYTLA